jgi:hypothetical protein
MQLLSVGTVGRESVFFDEGEIKTQGPALSCCWSTQGDKIFTGAADKTGGSPGTLAPKFGPVQIPRALPPPSALSARSSLGESCGRRAQLRRAGCGLLHRSAPESCSVATRPLGSACCGAALQETCGI